MATVAQQFFPHSVDWDGTDPGGGDVRTCETALPTATSGSSCSFGNSGAKTITVDPYTAGRTTQGLDSAFGWAIDIAGADGMDGTATAKRVIPTGTWLFEGTLFASPVAALNAVTVTLNVYRVAASPSTTRTLIFSDSVSAGLVAATGTAFSRTTPSQNEIVLEAGETVQFTITLDGTGQIGGLTIDYRTGDQATDCMVEVPTPGVRTRYLRDFTGASTPAGAIVRRPTKLLTASSTPAGAIVRKPSIFKTGSTTPTGAVFKTPSRFFTGTITPTGTVLRQPVKLLTGTITPGPSTIVRKPTKLLTATITPAGAVAKFVSRFFTGSTTPTGQVLKTPSIFMGGTVAPGPGTVTRRPTKLLTGSVPSSGSLITLITKNLTASIAPAGALIRRVSRFFTGTITPTGTVTKTPKKFFTGEIGGTGGTTIINRPIRVFED